MPAGHFSDRLNTQIQSSVSYLQEHLCNLSASFSRVRWQYPSTRKLHKLFYPCFRLTTTKVCDGSRIRTCNAWKSSRHISMRRMGRISFKLMPHFHNTKPSLKRVFSVYHSAIPPFARLSVLSTSQTAMLSQSTAA